MKLLSFALLSVYATIGFAQSSSKDDDFHLDKEYKIEANGVLRLTASDAKVVVTGSSRTTAHVKIDRVVTTKGWYFGGEQFDVQISESAGDLTIRENNSGTMSGIVGYYHEEYTINLELPANVSLVIKGDDGEYLISDVNGDMELDLDDADVRLTNCGGSKFNVRLDDGDLEMNKAQGFLDINADDADVNIRNASFDKIIADIDDGDFAIETSLTNSGDYFINAQDGLVSMTILGGGGNFNIRHDDARVIAEGNFNTIEKSENKTQLSLAGGNASISIHADDGRIRLIR